MELTPTNYTHQFLIAMPKLGDARFARSVVYIFQHDEDGALGLIINKALEKPLHDLLAGVECPNMKPDAGTNRPIHYGGPVEPHMGFVLHRGEDCWSSSWRLEDDLCVTTTRDILDAIAQGEGPEQYLVALGYAGWSAGQIEEEMANNDWLISEPALDLMFDVPLKERWSKAASRIGVDLLLLSDQVGHA